jgi:hypothetical protein
MRGYANSGVDPEPCCVDLNLLRKAQRVPRRAPPSDPFRGHLPHKGGEVEAGLLAVTLLIKPDAPSPPGGGELERGGRSDDRSLDDGPENLDCPLPHMAGGSNHNTIRPRTSSA